ncbi:hypothetical protein DENSPDRAFT_836013 [Dentipellis sp. KUC8613]|nr:hypothetical protein DENSPDRAFT_836013 [Dentipellis sp. KUC8613]
MAVEAEKSSKKHARSDSAVSNSATPAAKKAKGESAGNDNATMGNASDVVTSDSDKATVTLYAWGFEDSPFEDNHELAAVTSDLLVSLQSCKPEAWVPDEELANLPELIAMSLDADNEDIDDEGDEDNEDGEDGENDEDGEDDAESGGMQALFGPLLDNEYQFAVICGCEPNFSIMEITLAKKKPSKGPSVKVGLRKGDMSDLDGFMASGRHPLQKEGFTWVTGVRVDKTRTHLRVVQKIVSMHMGMKDTVSDPEGESNDKAEKDTGTGQTGTGEASAKVAV